MGVGAVLEPLVVIVLLFGGTWINRTVDSYSSPSLVRRKSSDYIRSPSRDSLESGFSTPSTKDGLLSPRSPSPSQLPVDGWRKRHVGLFGLSFQLSSPNTSVFRNRLLSRLLRKLPFLAECWYWALVYWVCEVRLGSWFAVAHLPDRHISSVVHSPPSPSKKAPSMWPDDTHSR